MSQTPGLADRPHAAPSPARLLSRARYGAAQTARVAWFYGQFLLAKRLAQPDAAEEPRRQPKAPPGDRRQIWLSFLDLFAQDRRNIEAGLYPPPMELAPERLPAALAHSFRFFRDLPTVDARRRARAAVEVRSEARSEGRFPAYYLQNFHYQTGGWLTEESARLYDTQVEILFGGAADAMRRIALGSLSRSLRGLDQRKLHVLDLACGNGRFMRQVLEAFPRLALTGLDLSPAYVQEARRRLAPWPGAELAVGQAEAMPFPDDAFDAVTCVYLFHELPPKVRRSVAAEIARVLKPGGVLVLADSLQTGDARDMDRMLENFPESFHEPFYNSYLQENLPDLFAANGLALDEQRLAFLTKVQRFRKAAAPARKIVKPRGDRMNRREADATDH